MLKSRLFRIAIIGLLAVLILPPVIYRLRWYPTTLRGKLDRIQFGMTEKEVKKILGEPGYYSKILTVPHFGVNNW